MQGLLYAFGAMRSVVGATSWLAPFAAGKLWGFGEVNADPHAAFTLRLFGARDLVLGATLLVLPSILSPKNRDTLRAILMMGVVVDVLDVCAGVIGYQSLSNQSLLICVGGAAVFAAMGEICLAQLPSAVKEN